MPTLSTRSPIFSPLQVIAREDEGEHYEHGDVEIHVMNADTSEFSSHQFIDDSDEYVYGVVETHAIDADASDFSPH